MRPKTFLVWEQLSQDIICLQTLVSGHHWSQDTGLRTSIVFRHSLSLDSRHCQSLSELAVNQTTRCLRLHSADDQALLVAGLTWPLLALVPVSLKTLSVSRRVMVALDSETPLTYT